MVWKSLNLSADFGFAVVVMQPNAKSAKYVPQLNHILFFKKKTVELDEVELQKISSFARKFNVFVQLLRGIGPCSRRVGRLCLIKLSLFVYNLHGHRGAQWGCVFMSGSTFEDGSHTKFQFFTRGRRGKELSTLVPRDSCSS